MVNSRKFSLKVLAGHIFFWIAYIYYQGIILDWKNTDELKFHFSFHIGGIQILMTILLTYLNLYVLLPAFYYRQRFPLYVITLLLSLFGGAVLLRFITNEFIIPWEKIHDPARYMLEVKHFWILSRIIRLSIESYPVIAVVTVFEMMNRALRNEKRLRDLEREKSAAEMSFLKAQINPHFFFNTMNSLYALILKQSDEAGKLVMRLSKLMRYMIYQVNQEKVELTDEIAELENYLAIEQTRFANRLDLSLNYSGDLRGRQIMPLTLLPFAENAIKHGIEEGKGWIVIILKVSGRQLFYSVENTTESGTTKGTPGIGLKNLKRRLELTYPGRHALLIKEADNIFTSELKIEL